jgi:hypothetical protein
MTDKTISPLRQRMIEDMMVRSFDPRTQSHYIRAVKKLTAFLGHSPDTAERASSNMFRRHASSGFLPRRTPDIASARTFVSVVFSRATTSWGTRRSRGSI